MISLEVGVVRGSDVYDDRSLIRLNEPWSKDLVCRGGRNIEEVSIGSTKIRLPPPKP